MGDVSRVSALAHGRDTPSERGYRSVKWWNPTMHALTPSAFRQPYQCFGAWASISIKESSESRQMIKCKTYGADPTLPPFALFSLEKTSSGSSGIALICPQISRIRWRVELIHRTFCPQNRAPLLASNWRATREKVAPAFRRTMRLGSLCSLVRSSCCFQISVQIRQREVAALSQHGKSSLFSHCIDDFQRHKRQPTCCRCFWFWSKRGELGPSLIKVAHDFVDCLPIERAVNNNITVDYVVIQVKLIKVFLQLCSFFFWRRLKLLSGDTPMNTISFSDYSLFHFVFRA